MGDTKLMIPTDVELFNLIKDLPNSTKLQQHLWSTLSPPIAKTKSPAETKPRRFCKRQHYFDAYSEDDADDEAKPTSKSGKDGTDSDDQFDAILEGFRNQSKQLKEKVSSTLLFKKSAFRELHQPEEEGIKKKKVSSKTIARPLQTSIEYLKRPGQQDPFESQLEDFRKNTKPNKNKSAEVVYLKKAIQIDELEDDIELDDSLDRYYDITFRKESPPNKKTAGPRNTNFASKTISSQVKEILPRWESQKPEKGSTRGKTVNVIHADKAQPAVLIEEMDMLKDRKLKALVEKCIHSLEDIRLIIDVGIPAPDGDEDYARRKKRALEFSMRFSRVYLYQLNRQLADIRKLCRPRTLKPGKTVAGACQKFTQTFQQIHQSMQAYYNHIPSSIAIGVPEKLKDLLNVCISICQLQPLVGGSAAEESKSEMTPGGDCPAETVFQVFQARCSNMIDHLQQYATLSSTTSLVQTNRSKLSMLGYKVSKTKQQSATADTLKSKKSRFSMYGGNLSKDVYWRNAISSMAKKRFDVPSRYKTATFKHRPPPDNIDSPAIPLGFPQSIVSLRAQSQDSLQQQNLELQLQLQRQNQHIRNHRGPKATQSVPSVEQSRPHIGTNRAMAMTPVCECDNTEVDDDDGDDGGCDDDAKVVVSVDVAASCDRMSEVRSCVEARSTTTTMLMEKRSSVLNNDAIVTMVQRDSGGGDCDGDDVAIDGGVGMAPVHDDVIYDNKIEYKERTTNDENLSDVMNELTECDRVCRTPSKKKSKKHSKQKRDSAKKQRTKITSVTGARNAKLICMRDDNSLLEPSDTDTRNAQSSQADFERPMVAPPPSCVDLDNTVIADAKQRNVKISRLPKNKVQLHPLQLLDKDYSLNIIKYKLNFHRQRKDNPLYRKTRNQMQPWELMEKVSDGILDDLLLAVSREIQVDDILARIYDAEFCS